jgi:hypothetical protein
MNTDPLASLSEAEIEALEAQIPALAEAATRAAFEDALARGHSVVCARGDELVEIAPDGTVRWLKSLPPNVSLPVGTVIELPPRLGDTRLDNTRAAPRGSDAPTRGEGNGL